MSGWGFDGLHILCACRARGLTAPASERRHTQRHNPGASNSRSQWRSASGRSTRHGQLGDSVAAGANGPSREASHGSRAVLCESPASLEARGGLKQHVHGHCHELKSAGATSAAAARSPSFGSGGERREQRHARQAEQRPGTHDALRLKASLRCLA